MTNGPGSHNGVIRRLSTDEIRLLSILGRLAKMDRALDRENIIYLIDRKIPSLSSHWQRSARTLTVKGIVRGEDRAGALRLSLTPLGEQCADWVERQKCLTIHFHNEFYRRAERSKAHSEFCTRVYGKDLCQHGMSDMNQIQKLLAAARLGPASRVLELGCGNGLITEYVSDTTGAHVTGVDIAYDAIERANERTLAKRSRLAFQVHDMDSLNLGGYQFDAIVCIDSLYFSRALEDVMKTLRGALKLYGRMFLFYHFAPDTPVSPGMSPAGPAISPEGCSPLAGVLERLGLYYTALDFTRENSLHWAAKERVLRELAPAFEAEGNMFLFNSRMDECEGRFGSWYRYLYEVEGSCHSERVR
jgi:cyclopropane fatty-acyl-phospholipid synthase-like methyltransferase